MGKHTDMWDWKNEGEREKWKREHPILKMVIPMLSEDQESKNRNQERLENE